LTLATNERALIPLKLREGKPSMRKILFTALLASASLLSLAAHADTIDDFVLTGNGHTISYSLPATSAFPDFSLFNFFTESASITVDGIFGYVEHGDYYVILVGPSGPLMTLGVPSAVFGTSFPWPCVLQRYYRTRIKPARVPSFRHSPDIHPWYI
jgi:hypothetical protein